jgi:ribosomal protein S27AE
MRFINQAVTDATKARARYLTLRAIADGILIRPRHCEECAAGGRIEAHHVDYSRPLHVRFLCVRCHKNQHRGSRPIVLPDYPIRPGPFGGLVCPASVCIYLDISDLTLTRLVRDFGFPVRRFGTGKRRFDAAEVWAWVRERRESLKAAA